MKSFLSLLLPLVILLPSQVQAKLIEAEIIVSRPIDYGAELIPLDSDLPRYSVSSLEFVFDARSRVQIDKTFFEMFFNEEMKEKHPGILEKRAGMEKIINVEGDLKEFEVFSAIDIKVEPLGGISFRIAYWEPIDDIMAEFSFPSANSFNSWTEKHRDQVEIYFREPRR